MRSGQRGTCPLSSSSECFAAEETQPITWAAGPSPLAAALAARDLVRDLVGADAALDGLRDGRSDRAEQGPETEADRGHVDLAVATLDRAHDRCGHLLRRTRSDTLWQHGAALREHPRVPDEAGEDARHADAGAVQVLAKALREAAQPELRGGVERRARRRDLPRQGVD